MDLKALAAVTGDRKIHLVGKGLAIALGQRQAAKPSQTGFTPLYENATEWILESVQML